MNICVRICICVAQVHTYEMQTQSQTMARARKWKIFHFLHCICVMVTCVCLRFCLHLCYGRKFTRVFACASVYICVMVVSSRVCLLALLFTFVLW